MDLDMTVTGPNGDSKSSANSGADEAVKLTARDFRNWGYGDYTVSIVWFIGNPSISFTLTIEVEYGADQILMEGSNIAPGEHYTFVVPLSSTDMGDNTINVAVTGTVFYEHSEDDDSGGTDSALYTSDESSNLKVGNKFVYSEPEIDKRGSINILLIERVLGLLSGFLFLVSIGFSSMLPPISTRVERLVGGGAKRTKWHCRISQILLALALIHGLMLPFSPHASSLRGLLPGTQAFVIMGILGYIGWKQNVLRKQWGNEKWKNIHLILSILALVIIFLHAIMDGTDFAWLRG
jgi:succinate dehydrogenase hydrophobic anchor subunit